MPTNPSCLSGQLLTPTDIVRAVRHLPSSPKILPRLKRMLRDGNSALTGIVALVRLDPGLALRVLQVANSPYFFTGARCGTVEQAVTRIGYDQIYTLVSQAVAAQVLNRPLVVYSLEADELWARSVACALAADALANRLGEDRAAAYTLGLLHGVGMIAIDEWALRTGNPLLLSLDELPDEATAAEQRLLGFTQADAGAELLQAWEFPEELVEPVRQQYAEAAAFAYPQLSSVLIAAKWLRSALLAPDVAARPPLPPAGVLRRVSLGGAGLEALLPELSLELARVRQVLEAAAEPAVDCEAFPARSWPSVQEQRA